MEFQWRYSGVTPKHGVDVSLDGKEVKKGVVEQNSSLDISGLPKGAHKLTLIAPGTAQRYRLLWTDDSQPLAKLEPASVTMDFIKK